MDGFRVTKFVVGILLAIALAFAVPALSQGPALPPGEYDLEAGQYVFNVPALQATDTPVAPSATPAPTDTPAPTGHNDTEWHPLTEAIGHEHGSDPNSVNDIFGEPGCWFGNCGQSISYPFETLNENVLKHEVYTWIVLRDLPPNRDPWIKAFRMEAHFTGGAFRNPSDPTQAFAGYLARFHSAMIEAQVCRQSDGTCGFVRIALRMDTGCLRINGAYHCLPGEEDANGSVRIYRAQQFWASGFPPAGRSNILWYTKFYGTPFGLLALNLEANDSSVNVDPDEISTLNLLCPAFDCEFNDSLKWVHRMKFRTLSFADPDGDGLVSDSGFLNQSGSVDAGCTSPSSVCLPYSGNNAPIGKYSYAPGLQLPAEEPIMLEFDTSPPGEFWIRHPN